MAQDRKKKWLICGAAFFVLYFFAAARPIKPEIVLSSRWLSSLESGITAVETNEEPNPHDLIPFSLGDRFGYVDSNGQFAINQIKKGGVYLSQKRWTEYGEERAFLEIKDNVNKTAIRIEDPRGYPLLLDDRIFIIGSEQNLLSEADGSGKILWTYEFAAPLTCIDAAAGLTLTGSIDGVVEVLNNEGKRVFLFEPGGSRYAVIAGCALSRDGSRIAVISGIDDQRFLLLERFGGAEGEYKAVYHEFLDDGFRRPVHITFIENDRWIVFEREEGLGVYELSSRQLSGIALEGEILAVDHSGGQGIFFVITSQPSAHKELVGLRLPGTVMLKAPFKSAGVFLDRTASRLYLGGGTTLASFELERK